MDVRTYLLLTFEILGGLCLFILGMNTMTDGLREAAGSNLRKILGKATSNRFTGILMGTTVSTLVQSSATTVMLVGFINAGLMTLAQAVPPVLGANIGTTVSMQLISIHLGEYCFIAITIGLTFNLAFPQPTLKNGGKALLGFGMIFLGMNIMSDAIAPHKDLFASFLKNVHGDTWAGMIRGLLIAAGITGIIQSSGAVIGMCFALIRAGVFTELNQVYPIILGAHIGTCATALLGSIGTNIDARRSAVAHLVFNVINSSLCIALSPVFLKLIPMTANDLVRQAANVHSLTMVFGTLVFLPFTSMYARFIQRIMPSAKPPPEPSFLESKFMDQPEKAIYASISELQRVTKICIASFRLTIDLLFKTQPREVQAVKLNEQIVDDIKLAMKEYLTQIAKRHLSRRQAVLIQHLNRCMADLERIGDHIDEICDISLRRRKVPAAIFNRETLELLFTLYEAADKVLHLVVESLNPENVDFQSMAQNILAVRDDYVDKSLNAKAAFLEKIANHEFPPIVGMFFSEYVAAFDRIVKHAKTIALVEKQPYFWIKRKKLEKTAEDEPTYAPPPLSDPRDFLDRLHHEDYL